MADKIENAVVKHTQFGIEDHGILSAWVHLGGSAWGQGFGGYALDRYDAAAKKRIGSEHAGIFVRRVLETLGVEEWEKLKGTPCRVRRAVSGGPIDAIGHFTDDKWFEPAVEFGGKA